MKKLRITVCAIFLVSLALLGAYMLKTRFTRDDIPPVIETESDTITVSVSDDNEKLMEGIKAHDNRDGDITSSVRIASKSHFYEPSTRRITYVVFDSANNPATIERELKYSDYVPPRIKMTHSMRYSLNEISSSDFKKNLTATDSIDGDITKQIRINYEDDSYYYGNAGTYMITLQVNNSAGDVCSVPVELVVTDNSDKEEREKMYPALSEYIVYTDGSELDFSSYLVGIENMGITDEFDGDDYIRGVDKSDIAIKSNVDYSTPGVYTVDYSYTSDEGVTAVTKLYVVVEEKQQ